MASLNAIAVAEETLSIVGKGGKVNMGSLLKKHGYAKHMARNPYKVTQTKSYQSIVNPVVKKLEDERARIMDAMRAKDLSEEKYAVLVNSLDVLTKNHQLLSGGSTQNVAMRIEISEAIADKFKGKDVNVDKKSK